MDSGHPVKCAHPLCDRKTLSDECAFCSIWCALWFLCNPTDDPPIPQPPRDEQASLELFPHFAPIADEATIEKQLVAVVMCLLKVACTRSKTVGACVQDDIGIAHYAITAVEENIGLDAKTVAAVDRLSEEITQSTAAGAGGQGDTSTTKMVARLWRFVGPCSTCSTRGEHNNGQISNTCQPPSVACGSLLVATRRHLPDVSTQSTSASAGGQGDTSTTELSANVVKFVKHCVGMASNYTRSRIDLTRESVPQSPAQSQAPPREESPWKGCDDDDE